MENLEIRIQKTTFDVETQYCDPSDCYHDCDHEGPNNCDAHFTEIGNSRTDNQIFYRQI